MFDRPTIQTGNASAYVVTGHSPVAAIPPPFPPDGIGEILSEGRQMDKAITALHEEIEMLVGKLALVLKPSSPDAQNGTATPTPMRSGIADGLADANRRIYAANARLAELRSRVDL